MFPARLSRAIQSNKALFSTTKRQFNSSHPLHNEIMGHHDITLKQTPNIMSSDFSDPVSTQFRAITSDDFRVNIAKMHNNEPLSDVVFNTVYHNMHDGCGIYCNNDVSMAHIHTVGFDFDYTLANYNENLDKFVYRSVMEELVHTRGYPAELLDLKYDSNFGIKGLFFDKETGYFLKVDQFYKIQSECVYYGRRRVPLDDILKRYDGLGLSRAARAECFFFADLFSIPEVSILADVIQHFVDKGLPFHPRYIQQDVRDCVEYLHAARKVHTEIMSDPAKFIIINPDLAPFLHRLKQSGKRTFLLTNSPFNFVDVGMHYMLQHTLPSLGVEKWQDLFDIVMVNARKPNFYTSTAPFREYDPVSNTISKNAVTELSSGRVYTEGGLSELTRLQNMNGRNVLYVGDHLTNDLALPIDSAVWRTCAVVKEVRRETALMQTSEFQTLISKQMKIEALISVGQVLQDNENKALVDDLKKRRLELRHKVRNTFSKFGSAFRTNTNRSLFFHELSKTADIYTHDVTSLLKYPANFTFYANRTVFPHEKQLEWANMYNMNSLTEPNTQFIEINNGEK